MKNRHLPALAAAVCLAAGPVGGQTGWIRDTMSDQCGDASKSIVADATRRSIESGVARAEASIRTPAAVADLSCLDGLLSADLDVFSGDRRSLEGSGLEGVIGDFLAELESGLGATLTLDSGVERAICDFARETFEEPTSGPVGSMDRIVARASPGLPRFEDRFGLLNLPSDPRPARRRAAAPPIPATSADRPDRGRAAARTAPAPSGGRHANSPSAGSESKSPGGIQSPIQSIWNAIKGESNR